MGYLFMSPWLIGFLVFAFVPIVASLFLSFTDYNLFSAPQWIDLGNFERMFLKDPRYWRAVKATFSYIVAAVPIRLAVALAVAMLLNRGTRLVGFYRAAYYAPSIVGSSVAVAVMWRQLFGGDGLINSFLTSVGIHSELRWLGNPQTAIWTLIILAAWQFGSPMIIFLAGLKQIPSELYEAAAIDGAGERTKFFRITLPMLSSVILFNLVAQMINGFLVFTQAYLITNGRPLDTTLVYGLYLYRRAFEDHQFGYGAAMAWVMLATIAFLTFLIFRSSPYWVFYETRED
jgi:multiple sugar transport system permease protein